MVTQNTNLHLANYLPIPAACNNILIFRGFLPPIAPKYGFTAPAIDRKYGNIFAYLPVKLHAKNVYFGHYNPMIMQKQLYLLLASSVLLLAPACKKKGSDDPCSGVTITVDGTITKATQNDGAINANATGSTNFTFRLDNGAYQATGNFTGLAPGTYTVMAKDANGCTGQKSFTVDPSKTALISQGTWKFSNAKIGSIDVSAGVSACQKDNIATFNINGTGSIDEGPTKCAAGDPQTSNYTWAFQTSETQLFISTPLFTGGSSLFTLVSLTATQLVVSQNMTVPGFPTPQTVTVTFIH
jgi:hypothetical protein